MKGVVVMSMRADSKLRLPVNNAVSMHLDICACLFKKLYDDLRVKKRIIES
jgi:hypothetical protein